MASAPRIAVGLLVICALALPASGVASSAGGVRASVGFQPVPLSIAADAAGHVYLSDSQRSQIQQYASDGALLASWGGFAPSGSAFQPRSIATDAAANLYVADSERDLLSVLGPDGVTLRQWQADSRDVAVGAGGVVYVATGNEVQRFAPDGTLLSKWGGAGSGDGQLGSVYGLDTSPSGNVYVADTYSNRIQVFSAEGAFITKWGSYGKGDRQFVFPYGIATDAAGNVYVADTANARIQKFTASGAFLGSWGGPGRGPGRFFTPLSVATDAAGFVYVADRGEPYPAESGARIQKFTANGEFVTEWGDIPPRPLARPRLSSTVGKRTAKRFASFRFVSPYDDARFQCRLTGKLVPPKLRAWRACASPKRYARLQPGRKLFHVRTLVGSKKSSESRRPWLIVG